MRGTTLIELLIALALAGLAIAGALTGFAQLQRAWRDASLQGRLHERAQYVFATLEPELQMAGFYGRGPAPTFESGARLPGSASICGTELITRLVPPLEVQDDVWRLPCTAQGRGALPGRDVLITRRASVALSDPAPGPIRLRNHPFLPEVRSVLWPGATTTLAPASTAPTELRDLIVRIYYVARSADGDDATPALRVKSLTAIAGQPAFIDTEVMPGVEDLQIELLPTAIAPQSVRVGLRVRADPADARSGEALPELALTRRFALRNAPGA